MLLKEVVEWLLGEWPVAHLVVTCIDRTDQENVDAKAKTKVHVVGGRAIDIRIKNIGGDFQRVALALAKKINRRWLYDPRRPNLKVAFARAHGTGPHIHLQVHWRSIRSEFRKRELARAA
jgi:hypothetical protein